jgi:threonyl-tRNA synthetase
MIAVLCEHTAGKWPFWLSPRQVRRKHAMQARAIVRISCRLHHRSDALLVPSLAQVCVVPVSEKFIDYANSVRDRIHGAG